MKTNELWQEVGALNSNVKVRYDEPFRSMEYEGKIIYLYRNLQKLEQHFNELSPEDNAMTKQLIKAVKAFTNMQVPIMDIQGVKAENPRKMSVRSILKMAPHFSLMNRMSQMSTAEYINQFKSPAIRIILFSVIPEDYSATSLLFTMATLAAGDGGYPEGGSLAMIKRMSDKFIKLGGKISYQIKVDKVIIKDGAAAGVSVNGNVIPADAVIITQEVLAAADQLFDKPLQDEWIVKLRKETKPAACCFVSVGVKAVLKETPTFMLKNPIQCGGFEYDKLTFNNYYGYEGYAPDGSTALTLYFGGDSYDFWKKAKDEGRYEAEKQAVTDQIIKAMYQKYPQIDGKIEVVDVATPLTYERYTGSSKGSWMSVLEKAAPSMSTCPCTLKDIAGVYFAGHRTMVPGGMLVALYSGRRTVQMVCCQFNSIFKNN